ncbi:MAG: L,D-transpeptidase [Akkermansiaceae bacterium]
MIRLLFILALCCASISAQTLNVPPPLRELPEEPAPKAVPIDGNLTSDKPAEKPTTEPDTQSEEKKPVLTLPEDRDEAVRLQIFLDQKHFGPGIIDGKPGTFTKLAIENYNVSLGRAKDDPRVIEEALKGVPQAYATAIVPSTVKDFVDHTLPYKRSQQAKRKSMPYRSVAEFMAERYHSSEDLLIAINSSKVVRNAKTHSAMKVPNIQPFRIENLKHGRSHKSEESLTAQRVVVDTKIKQVYVYTLILPTVKENADGTTKVTKARPQLVASFPITPGKPRFIPIGIWNLKNSVELPTWRYDKRLLETGVRGKEYLTIPAGPNNPVGVIWNGLSKSGIGIHGTNNPRTIGRAQSAGCIRLSNWDAARFPTLVRPGAIVEVK